ncbi:MAG: hypothetical protein QW434_09785 [Pyrobaculum sp.]
MRLLIALLAVVAVVYALETDHFVVIPDDQTLANYLEEAYGYYKDKGLDPAPPCQGDKYKVYVDPSSQYDAYTALGNGCIVEQRFKPGYTRRLAFHEVGHIFFAKYDSAPGDYFWADEATPEAMASVATGVYYFPSKYFSERLYKVDPFSLGEDKVYDWYKYSAVVAWYLQQAQQWKDLLRVISTRQGAAALYVRFLLALPKGVDLGGVTYRPDMERIEVSPGAVRAYPEFNGYTAVYYEVDVPPGGVLRIAVEGDGANNIVSNIAIGREIVVTNGTILLALVNNSSKTVRPTIVFYYSNIKAKVLSGVYRDGHISVKLYAEYGFQRLSGLAKINGSDIYFSDGIAVYNFTGGLRPYVLRIEYNNTWGYLFLNLTQPRFSVSPTSLYLDVGGWGFINVTISHTNPLAIECTLNGTSRGVAFKPIAVLAPAGNNTYRLYFQVSGTPGEKIDIRCGNWSTSIPVYKPSYKLEFDLDKWRGKLYVQFGSSLLVYNITDLPASINVTFNGYTAAVLALWRPSLNVNLSNPRLNGGLITYNVSINVDGLPWAVFKGTVRIDEKLGGNYQGGVFNTTLSLEPGKEKDITIAVGKLSTTVHVMAPSLKIELIPLGAVVEGGKARLLVKINYNIEVVNAPPIVFDGPGLVSASSIQQNLAILTYNFNDTIVIRHKALGGENSVIVRLPRPEFNISLLRGEVTPERFQGEFNVSLKVCNPSVTAKYIVAVGNRSVVLNVQANRCAYNWTLISLTSAYSPSLVFSVSTSFGDLGYRVFAPPPNVTAEIKRWLVNEGGEYVDILLRVKTPAKYTYKVMGRGISGEAVLNITAIAFNGTALVDYGFGALKLFRPGIILEAAPVIVEVNTPYTLNVTLRVPEGLYINATLNVSHSSAVPVALSPGVHKREIFVKSPPFPGAYNLSLRVGPYENYTTVVAYGVYNLTLMAPKAVVVGVPVEVKVVGRVKPLVNISLPLAISGCGNFSKRVPLNGSVVLRFEKPCTASLVAYTNSTRVSAEVKWASLTVEISFERLGTLRGLPVFPARGLSAKALLGGAPVNGTVRIVGDFDKLGYVNYTVYVEYMGVVNKTEFLGFAVPLDNYLAANKTATLLPPDARPYFLFLLEKAVAMGDWGLVDGISRLYSNTPTPLTLVARYLVERDLSRGRDPNVEAAEILRRLEPVIFGVVGGLALAVIRRFA